MAVAMRNTQNSTSMLQTAEGALSELDSILVRMKDLATQAADASSTASDKSAMQAEYSALNTEIGNILDNTTFAGKAMLRNGTLAFSMTFQIGVTAGETMSVDLSVSLNSMLGHVGNAAASALTATPNASIDLLAMDINVVGNLRSSLGAVASRLDHVHNNLANVSTHTRAAARRIMDADFAQESANMTTGQMLMQAGTAMLKQSSSMSSMVMSLLG
jgi:flagellin